MRQPQPFRHLDAHLLLGQLLIEAGYLTSEQLAHARCEQERIGALLGETLVGLGYVTEEAVARAIAHQCQLAFFEPANDRDDDELRHHDWLRERRLVPKRGANGELRVITDRPPDATLQRDLSSTPAGSPNWSSPRARRSIRNSTPPIRGAISISAPAAWSSTTARTRPTAS